MHSSALHVFAAATIASPASAQLLAEDLGDSATGVFAPAGWTSADFDLAASGAPYGQALDVASCGPSELVRP